MQHFVYVECTFGHIYYTIPINNISQGFLVSFGQLLGSQDIQDSPTQTQAQTQTDGQTVRESKLDRARRQRFSLWYLQQHRQLVIVLLLLGSPPWDLEGGGGRGTCIQVEYFIYEYFPTLAQKNRQERTRTDRRKQEAVLL